MFAPQDRITVTERQLIGNISNVVSGEVVTVQGTTATVMLEGHSNTVDIPVSQLTREEETYGDAYTNAPNELGVENHIHSWMHV